MFYTEKHKLIAFQFFIFIFFVILLGRDVEIHIFMYAVDTTRVFLSFFTESNSIQYFISICLRSSHFMKQVFLKMLKYRKLVSHGYHYSYLLYKF